MQFRIWLEGLDFKRVANMLQRGDLAILRDYLSDEWNRDVPQERLERAVSFTRPRGRWGPFSARTFISRLEDDLATNEGLEKLPRYDVPDEAEHSRLANAIHDMVEDGEVTFTQLMNYFVPKLEEVQVNLRSKLGPDAWIFTLFRDFIAIASNKEQYSSTVSKTRGRIFMSAATRLQTRLESEASVYRYNYDIAGVILHALQVLSFITSPQIRSAFEIAAEI
jgi:hypothetical protein